MTDQSGGAPSPQDPGGWQTTPPPAAPPPQFQPAPMAAGPAPGVAYADVVTRIIALVIDGVILIVIGIVVGIIFAAIGATGGTGIGILLFLVGGVVSAIISAVYFVYGWTRLRASYGQKFLNLETVNAADGATLTQDQAIRRWAFLWGPNALAGAIPIIGLLIWLVAIVYDLYLLYTVSQSPKRQGFHDVQAGTVVVKRG